MIDYLEITAEAPTDTCDCPASGDWVVHSDDNCVLNTTCDIGTNTLRLIDKGSGSFSITPNGQLNLGAIDSTSTDIKVAAGGEINFR